MADVQEPEDLFETISQTLLNSVDRDALSGWGAVVRIMYVRIPHGTGCADKIAPMTRSLLERSAHEWTRRSLAVIQIHPERCNHDMYLVREDLQVLEVFGRREGRVADQEGLAVLVASR